LGEPFRAYENAAGGRYNPPHRGNQALYGLRAKGEPPHARVGSLLRIDVDATMRRGSSWSSAEQVLA
jgi:hypothetical protein